MKIASHSTTEKFINYSIPTTIMRYAQVSYLSILFIFSLILIPTSSFSLSDYLDFYAGRVVAGKDLEHWAKEYWQWLMTQPSVLNNGECYLGHSSNNSIIFLMSSIPNTYNGQCDISSEPILVPLLISECDKSLGEKRLLSGMIKDFWSCAIDANNGIVSWHVTLDHQDLMNKESNVEMIHPDLEKAIEVRNSTFFNFTIPETNRYDIPKDEIGTFPAVVGGWYLVLKPLPLGEHTLSYSVDRVAGEGESMTSEHGSVSYKLTVR